MAIGGKILFFYGNYLEKSRAQARIFTNWLVILKKNTSLDQGFPNWDMCTPGVHKRNFEGMRQVSRNTSVLISANLFVESVLHLLG